MQFLWEWIFWNFHGSQQIWTKTLKRTCYGICLFCKFTDTQPATLSKNKNPINDIFQAICPYLRNRCLKVDLKGKSHNFETEWILCYSTCQQGTLYLEVTNGQFFTKQKRAVWLTPFAFKCEWSKDTWKLQSESKQWKVQCMVH